MESPNSSAGWLSRFLSPLGYLARSPLSLLGVILVTTAGVLWIFLLPTVFQGEAENPYVGILTFMILPAVFILGLILMPVGMAIHRARMKGKPPEEALSISSPEVRRVLAFIGVTTLANIVIVSTWGYGAVEYMEGDAFCGTTCHTPMQPEYTAYQASPHASAGCVGCHVGPGAESFVKAKLAGTRQLMALAFNTYSRPIPAPVHDMRQAKETCEHCHSRERFAGERLWTRTSYADDETNTPSNTVLKVKVGGLSWKGPEGIHGAHLDPKTEITYTALDSQRRLIAEVSYKAADGSVTTYKNALVEATPEQLAAAEKRSMDCLDCHNRAGHNFLLPESAVDRALYSGEISAALPFIKREAVAALRQEYADRDTASREIASRIQGFYKTSYPAADEAAVSSASRAVQGIYLQNIFPDMKIGWGTYPNNMGHTDAPGCFRCHDGSMTGPEDKAIASDCETCHAMPIMDESNMDLMSLLGLKTQ